MLIYNQLENQKFSVSFINFVPSFSYYIHLFHSYGEEVPFFDSTFYTTNFNIAFLFTNIRLEETINIFVDKIFHNKNKVKNLSKNFSKSLLELCFYVILYNNVCVICQKITNIFHINVMLTTRFYYIHIHYT